MEVLENNRGGIKISFEGHLYGGNEFRQGLRVVNGTTNRLLSLIF